MKHSLQVNHFILKKGSCVKISAKDKKGFWVTLWKGSPQSPSTGLESVARIFSPQLKKVNFKTKEIRLDIDQSKASDYYEIDAVKLYGFQKEFDDELTEFVNFNIHSLINVKQSSDFTVKVGNQEFYLHKTILSQNLDLFKDLKDKSSIELMDFNPRIFLPIIQLLYRNYYLDEIDENFLNDVFGDIQPEDLVDLVFILKKYHLDSLSEIMNTKLKGTISEKTVIDIIKKIDEYTKVNYSIRFDLTNPVKRLCFDFFNDYMKKNKTFQTEDFFKKFEDLDIELKIELLSSFKTPENKKDEDYWTQSEDEEDVEKKEKKEEKVEEKIEEEPMCLKKHLNILYQKGEFTDLTMISNDNVKFNVHKVIFASESKLILDLLEEGLDSIKFDFPSTTLKEYITWSYERMIKPPKDKESLLSLAKKYDVKGLEDALIGNVIPVVVVKKEYKFGWKLWSGSSGTTISEDKLTVTRTGSTNLDRVFGDKGLVKPKHYFEVKLVKMPKSNETYIGITDNLTNSSSRNNITVQMAGQLKNLCNGASTVWVEGDTVGVLVDYEKLICKFYKNGKFTNITGELKTNTYYYAVCHFKFSKDQYTLQFPNIPKEKQEIEEKEEKRKEIREDDEDDSLIDDEELEDNIRSPTFGNEELEDDIRSPTFGNEEFEID